MFLYVIQSFNGTQQKWQTMTQILADENREAVVRRWRVYVKHKVAGSAKARSREYRLAKFHYGGCRHLENPRAR